MNERPEARSSHMRENPIFGNDPDLNVVVRCLTDEWPKFAMAAYFPLGIPEVWEGAAYEVSDLYDRFEREGKDPRPLDRLFDMLAGRIGVLPDRETYRQKFQVVFGFFVPLNWRQKKQQEFFDRWMDDIKAGRSAFSERRTR